MLKPKSSHFVYVFCITFLVNSCGNVKTDNSNVEICKDTITQFDTDTTISEEVKTITIGKQIWMAENLSCDTFRNGDKINIFKNVKEWHQYGDKKQAACAVYNNHDKSLEKYGRLYNWYAVKDKRGICPEGFRVPDEDDFVELLQFVGGEKYDSEKVMESLSQGGSSGFNAQYGGWCCMDIEDEDGQMLDFVNIVNNAALWSSTEIDGAEYYLDKIALSIDLGSSWRTDSYGAVLIPTSSMKNAYSVRCIKN